MQFSCFSDLSSLLHLSADYFQRYWSRSTVIPAFVERSGHPEFYIHVLERCGMVWWRQWQLWQCHHILRQQWWRTCLWHWLWTQNYQGWVSGKLLLNYGTPFVKRLPNCLHMFVHYSSVRVYISYHSQSQYICNCNGHTQLECACSLNEHTQSPCKCCRLVISSVFHI